MVVNASSPLTMSVLLGNGDGTFQAPLTFNSGTQAGVVAVGDFNDGVPDLAEGTSAGAQIQIGKGDGTFNASTLFPGMVASNLTTGDFTGTGVSGILGAGGNALSVMVNPSSNAGAVALKMTLPASTPGGAAVPITVTAVDASGNTVPAFLGTVCFSSSDPQMQQPSFFYTFTAADAGTHTFPTALSLGTAGAETVTVKAPGLTPAVGAISVISAASGIKFSAPVANATTAGSPFAVTVSAVDNLGNVVSGYTGTVHFHGSDAQAALPAD